MAGRTMFIPPWRRSTRSRWMRPRSAIDFNLASAICAMFWRRIIPSSPQFGDRAGNPAQDRHLLPPYVILDREVVDDQAASIRSASGDRRCSASNRRMGSQASAGKVVARGAAETVRAFVPRCARRVPILSWCSHIRALPRPVTPIALRQNMPLAVARGGVDLMVAGHTHHAFLAKTSPRIPEIDGARGTVAGTPTVMAGQHGSHLGLADFDLIRADGRWLVTSARTEEPALSSAATAGVEALVEEDRALVEVIAPAHAATRAHMAKVVGISARPLHSYFSMLRPDACLQIVAQAQSDHITSALRGTVHEGLPILSAVSPFRAGGRGGRTPIPRSPKARSPSPISQTSTSTPISAARCGSPARRSPTGWSNQRARSSRSSKGSTTSPP